MNGDRKVVAYASRSKTDCESRYLQIEKEALALTWACDRFAQYVMGVHIHLETDHKPLIPLLGQKLLDQLPLRVQRFRLRLMRYSYDISYVPGKNLHTADALSRAPIENDHRDEDFGEEVETYVKSVMYGLECNVASTAMMTRNKQAYQEDPVCAQVMAYCERGWPPIMSENPAMREFYQVRDELSVEQGLILLGSRIVIPILLRAEILEKVHMGHLGIHKCRETARRNVWWPCMSSQIADMIRQTDRQTDRTRGSLVDQIREEPCRKCQRNRPEHSEPLMPLEFPERPWERIGTDLFHWHNSEYLIAVDYHSRFFEMAKLQRTDSESIIEQLKSFFARHGMPEVVMSDNGPQYAAETFRQFADKYGFIHVTSSPRYPQSNGEAERAVQTVKNLLRKNEYPYLALLAYRNAPLANGYSPAQLLVGRQLRSTVPAHADTLKPSIPDASHLKAKVSTQRGYPKTAFDTRHRALELPPLETWTQVWIKDANRNGVVTGQALTPRSYHIRTYGNTIIRRNRGSLVDQIREEPSSPPTSDSRETPVRERTTPRDAPRVDVDNPPVTVRRIDRRSRPPIRLDL